MCGGVYEEGVCGEGDDGGESEEGEKHDEKNNECEGLSGKLKLLNWQQGSSIYLNTADAGVVTRLQSVTQHYI